MAEATGMAIAAQYIGAAAAGLASIHWSWWFSNAATAVYWPVSYVVGFLSTVLGSVLLVPLAFAGRVVLSIFSPALYVASFFLSISVGIVHFIVSLEPLYIFFGVAALIGSLTGITVAASSALVISQLGLQDSPSDLYLAKQKRRYYLQGQKGLSGKQYRELSSASSDDTLHQYQPFSFDSSDDWTKLQHRRSRFEMATPLQSQRGLLSQTIHEEDDSDVPT